MDKEQKTNEGLEHAEGLEVMKRYLANLKDALPSQEELEEFRLACGEVREMMAVMTSDESADAYADFLDATLNHARSSQMLCQAWEGDNQKAVRLSESLSLDKPN